MENEKLVIEINGKFYTLIPKSFEENIEITDFLKIDHSNIFGELCTMPVVLNQIANLRADLENLVSHQKMGIEILRAELEKAYKASRNGAKTTVADVEMHVTCNSQYQKEQSTLIDLQRQYNYLDGFYWSAQAKINALQKISDKISPEEFSSDVLQKSINNVIIKKFGGKL